MIALGDDVRSEVLKLLVQVAWADDVIVLKEVEVMRRIALALGASVEQRLALERWLTHMEPLPPPNLGTLRPHRDSVLRAVNSVVKADGVVVEEEREIVQAVAELLDGTRAP